MIFNANTEIVFDAAEKPIVNAVAILKRDMAKCLAATAAAGGKIELVRAELPEERFVLEVSEDKAVLKAGDELGFVYGLLYISEKFLGVKPFWFWLDQRLERVSEVVIATGEYRSKRNPVRFRGWFINDEILIMGWDFDKDEAAWRMAFEALLRCGGNMVIPGTDTNSRLHKRTASEMGLWITQHHAEPLGAEMFARKYPGETPNYFENKEKFHRLWRDAVADNEGIKTIWSLGFRGQGDCPFWASDTSGRYDTDEKRGALISEIIELQRKMVAEKVENPVFCTNLYGEVMELYDRGCLSFDEDIIKISADNGFGKMVTRRQGNKNFRVSAMPKAPVNHGGIYYHVSFYDLQAANHLTMLPNTVDFVNRELDRVNDMNMTDFWVINCSNIRPHAYFLDAAAKKWSGRAISDAECSEEFAKTYYGGAGAAAKCLRDYGKMTIRFGEHEDEHAGEQFYTDNTRVLASHIMRGAEQNFGFRWFTGDVPLYEQIEKFAQCCRAALPKIEKYLDECREAGETLSGDTKKLFDSIILLQAKLHYYGCGGAALFGEGCRAYRAEDWFGAFMTLGDAAAMFDAANTAMRESESGVWKTFYRNDCFADYKHTAYVLKKLMGLARERGDNPGHWKWQREVIYAPEDRNVYTLLLWENHMEDWELYKAAKERIGNGEYKLPIE